MVSLKAAIYGIGEGWFRRSAAENANLAVD